MAIAEPYPVAFLSAILKPVDCQFSQLRFEEQSGSGNGQFWAAQLAPPLWQVAMSLVPRSWEEAREINAKVAALRSVGSFLFHDPSYRPASRDVAGGSVTVSAVSTARTTLALSGLPAGYRVTAGDRISITHSGGRYYFGTFAENVTANAQGSFAQAAVEPPLPQAIAAAAPVRLDSPLIRLRVASFTPFSAVPGRVVTGGSLTGIQKP